MRARLRTRHATRPIRSGSARRRRFTKRPTCCTGGTCGSTCATSPAAITAPGTCASCCCAPAIASWSASASAIGASSALTTRSRSCAAASRSRRLRADPRRRADAGRDAESAARRVGRGEIEGRDRRDDHRSGFNRGMRYDLEMLKYSGERYRVQMRVDKLINEKNGKMVPMKTAAIQLENVYCRAECTEMRLGCPRAPTPTGAKSGSKRCDAASDDSARSRIHPSQAARGGASSPAASLVRIDLRKPTPPCSARGTTTAASPMYVAMPTSTQADRVDAEAASLGQHASQQQDAAIMTDATQSAPARMHRKPLPAADADGAERNDEGRQVDQRKGDDPDPGHAGKSPARRRCRNPAGMSTSPPGCCTTCWRESARSTAADGQPAPGTNRTPRRCTEFAAARRQPPTAGPSTIATTRSAVTAMPRDTGKRQVAQQLGQHQKIAAQLVSQVLHGREHAGHDAAQHRRDLLRDRRRERHRKGIRAERVLAQHAPDHRLVGRRIGVPGETRRENPPALQQRRRQLRESRAASATETAATGSAAA